MFTSNKFKYSSANQNKPIKKDNFRSFEQQLHESCPGLAEYESHLFEQGFPPMGEVQPAAGDMQADPMAGGMGEDPMAGGMEEDPMASGNVDPEGADPLMNGEPESVEDDMNAGVEVLELAKKVQSLSKDARQQLFKQLAGFFLSPDEEAGEGLEEPEMGPEGMEPEMPEETPPEGMEPEMPEEGPPEESLEIGAEGPEARPPYLT